MTYSYPLNEQDYDTIQPGDTLLLPNGSLAICTAIEEPTIIPSRLGDIQQGRSFSMRVIGTPDRNPSPTQSATPKQALPGSDMSGQALPPTSDNTIYVAYARDEDQPALSLTSNASA